MAPSKFCRSWTDDTCCKSFSQCPYRHCWEKYQGYHPSLGFDDTSNYFVNLNVDVLKFAFKIWYLQWKKRKSHNPPGSDQFKLKFVNLDWCSHRRRDQILCQEPEKGEEREMC